MTPGHHAGHANYQKSLGGQRRGSAPNYQGRSGCRKQGDPRPNGVLTSDNGSKPARFKGPYQRGFRMKSAPMCCPRNERTSFCQIDIPCAENIRWPGGVLLGLLDGVNAG
jgi:hypothetical protein